jgi:hypothetical protein
MLGILAARASTDKKGSNYVTFEVCWCLVNKFQDLTRSIKRPIINRDKRRNKIMKTCVYNVNLQNEAKFKVQIKYDVTLMRDR